MTRRALLPAVLWLAVLGCSSTSTVDRRLLLGPWFTDGPSFDIVIDEHTILFESDMLEHPYWLEKDTLVIDFADGPQRKRITRLTKDEMEWRDETFGGVVVFSRKGIWERR